VNHCDRDWVCPVQGGSSFTDTFRRPRGTFVPHNGVDVRPESGRRWSRWFGLRCSSIANTLGGSAAYVQGADGNTYSTLTSTTTSVAVEIPFAGRASDRHFAYRDASDVIRRQLPFEILPA